MHTYNAPGHTRFIFNSDLSGDVEVTDMTGNTALVPGADLLEFVAQCYVAPERISRLEQAEHYDEILLAA